jgi:hypothetical protein
MSIKPKLSRRLLTLLLPVVASILQAFAAGPAPVNLRSTAPFVILSGAGITSTGGGVINGNVGASPIAGSAIGVTCAQVVGIIYSVDASGPPCAVIDASLLTTAKGDLTTAFNDAAGRTPTPTGPNLNPGLIPGSGNIGGMNLAPGLYKFTTTAMITGTDVTLTGGADDVWIFQCAQDLQLGSGIKVILAGGAQAKNIFWQVGTSAVLGTFSVFKGTILADQAVTMNTSSVLEGRALAFSAGVVFNGTGAALPTAAEIAVEQPLGINIADGGTKDFGSVLTGGNNSLTFTIKNTGNADLTGLNITIDGLDSALFTVTANPVAPVSGPSGSTTFTVRFAPATSGLKTAALHIANNDSDENPFDIALTGFGSAVAAPEIAVEQPLGVNRADGGSVDFGSITTGGNSSLLFTIKNTGNADLTGLNIIIDGVDSALFTVTANPTAPVAGPSGSTTFTVRFAPTTVGLKAAALHIANNDSDENPFDIAVTGVGTVVAGPEIVVEQPLGVNIADGGSKDFGPVFAGGNSSLTFTIRNIGNGDLTGLGITINGVDAGLFTVTANATAPVTGPAGVTTFTVRFAPGTLGLKTAALHIANNDSDENPFDITLTGTGTAVAAPEIAVEQPLGVNIVDGGSKDFGSVTAGGNNSLTFTIKNTGSADLTGLGITIDGAGASQFSVTANPSSPVGGPSGGTTFIVRFAPTSDGLKTAALHIASNDADENPFDITLTGTQSAALFPEIAVEQPLGLNIADGGSKDFGAVVVGANNSLTFTIKNTGGADLTGLGIVVDGVDAAQFTVTANPTSPVGGPSGGTTFIVRFAPATAGAKTAALHISSNDADENPFDITLTGSGTAAPAPEIAVEQPLGTDLASGATKDFGPVVTGANNSLSFTIRNTGNADLTGLGIVVDGADAGLFTVTANPTSPVGGPGGGTTFIVRFAPTTVGPKTAALHIASNDADENPFNISLTGSGTPNVVVGAISAITLNPQTGLFEQTVAFNNVGVTAVAAARLLILGLPADVQVHNASGAAAGTPFVQLSQSLAAGASVSFLIEYYRASRVTIPSPTFAAVEGAPSVTTPVGTAIGIDSRSVKFVGGRFLVEFPSTPGLTYAVQYSGNATDWITVSPTVVAPANRVQWYDDGPPKTASKPTSGSRFYRVIELR